MSLGSDFAGVSDLTWDLAFLEGESEERLAYLQAIGAALLSDVGSLEYAPTYGRGLFRYLSRAGVAASQIAADVAATCLDDERTDNVTVTPSDSGDDESGLTLSVTLYVRGGARYELTVSIDRIKAAIEVSTGAVVIVRRSL